MNTENHTESQQSQPLDSPICGETPADEQKPSAIGMLRDLLEGSRDFAVLSAFSCDKTAEENHARYLDLKYGIPKKFVRSHTSSKWLKPEPNGNLVSIEKRSMIVYGIPRPLAIEWAHSFDQWSIIWKDGEGCREICTRNDYMANGAIFMDGDVVRRFEVSKATLEDAKIVLAGPGIGPGKCVSWILKEIDLVHQPMASYFQTKEWVTKLYEE